MPTAHRDESFLSLGPHGFHRVAYSDWGAETCQHVVDAAVVGMAARQHGGEFGNGFLYGVDLWPT
jgi:hypothetical protein